MKSAIHQLTSTFAVFRFRVEPVVDVMDAVAAELEAMKWRDSTPVSDPIDQPGVVVRDQERAVGQLREVDRATPGAAIRLSQPSMKTSLPLGWPRWSKRTRMIR